MMNHFKGLQGISRTFNKSVCYIFICLSQHLPVSALALLSLFGQISYKFVVFFLPASC